MFLYTGLVTFMALSLFAKLLMMERDSWKRELPVSATSEISWLTAMMICEGGWIEKRRTRSKEGEIERVRRSRKRNRSITNALCIDSPVRANGKLLLC